MRGALAFKRFARSVSEPSDQDLVAGALNGEPAAFAELATRHRSRVERICQRFFSDLERAESAAFYSCVGTLGRIFMEIETEAFSISK